MARIKVSNHRKKRKTPKCVHEPLKKEHDCIVCGKPTNKPHMVLLGGQVVCSKACKDVYLSDDASVEARLIY